MTKQEIDRLGVMSYGVLILGVINGFTSQSVKCALDQGSLAVLIPFIAVNLTGVIVAGYCLFVFIGHLSGNRRVEGDWKVLWLGLLLFGNLVTMPVYWYWHIVRERIGETAGDPSSLSEAAPTKKEQAEQSVAADRPSE